MRRIDAVLICCYGCHATPDYRRHLSRVAGFCNIVKPRLIITSGGPTQQMSAPGLTEAEVALTILLPLCPDLDDTAWFVDPDAFTTPDNIRNAAAILTEQFTSPGTIAIFCDVSRALKVRLLAKTYAPGWHVIVETSDLQSNPKSQLVSTVIEAVMLYFQPLHWLWRSYRRWSAKRK